MPERDARSQSAPRFVPLEFARLPAEEASQRAREFAERMRTRRTVRQFSPDAVPYELVETAIRVAGSAPSGANQQPWTFVLVSDPEIKRRIREAAEAEERTNYEQRFPDEWLQALVPFGTDWHKEFLETAPWLIVVFRQCYGLAPQPDGSVRQVKHYYTMESVGIAVGFLLAALHWMGLATLTHTPSPMAFLGEILGRPENEKAYVLIPVGYPAPDARVPDIRRKSLEEVLKHFGPQP